GPAARGRDGVPVADGVGSRFPLAGHNAGRPARSAELTPGVTLDPGLWLRSGVIGSGRAAAEAADEDGNRYRTTAPGRRRPAFGSGPVRPGAPAGLSLSRGWTGRRGGTS